MIVILWVIGALIALVVLAMVLLPVFIDEQAVIDLAKEQVKTSTGGELVVSGDVSMSFFPRFGLSLGETALTLPAQTEFDPSISASLEELDIGLSLLPLLSGNIDVGTIVIAGVSAEITEPQALPAAPEPQPVMSDREWDKRGKQIRDAKEAERQRQLAETGGVSGVSIEAEALRIENITLKMRSREGVLQNEIRISALTLSSVNTDNDPMTLEGAITILGDGSAAPLQINLEGGIRVASDFSRIQLENLVTDISGALSQPISSRLAGDYIVSPAKANLTLSASIPGGDIDGQLVWSALESPEIVLKVSTERLDVDQIQPAAAPAGAQPTAQAPSEASTPASAPGGSGEEALGVYPLPDIDLEMTVTADALLAGGQVISNAQLAVRILDGIATVEHLRGTLHQGQLDTRVVLNARRPTIEAEVKGGLKGVNIGELLASVGNPDRVSGRVEMGWDLETKGATADALLQGLDGDLSSNGEDLVLEALSVQGLVCKAISAVNKTPPPGDLPGNTPITELALKVEFDEGRGEIDKLRFSTPGVLLKGEGDVSLATLDYAVRLEGQVNNELSEVSAACAVDDRYAGVDWPVDCKGSLAGGAESGCAVDVAYIAQQILENEAKSKITEEINEKAGGFIKKLFGD